MTKPLLTPVKLGPYTLKNRIVVAPMTRVRATVDYNVNDMMVEYYRQRASAGLIINEGTIVAPDGAGYIRTGAIYSKRQIAGWKRVTDVVHEEGGRIFCQLWHTGAVSNPVFHNGFPPRAPSAVDPKTETFTTEGFKPSVMPREMDIEDIKEAVDNFRQAAANAIEAGFDGVEIHASNGYIFDQFLRDGSNKRTDEYGGSIENRARFLFEVLDAIVAEIGEDRVGLRLAPSGVVQVSPESDTRATYGYVIERLNNYKNLAFLELLETVVFLEKWDDHEADADCDMVKEVAKHYRKIYKGTLITNGGYDQEKGNQAIEEGFADLVSYGNLYISNPDLVERFEQDAELNEIDQEHMYEGEEVGYSDYPKL